MSTAIAEPATVPRAEAFTGTLRLIRLAGRRDRIIVTVWLVVIVGLLLVSVASIVALYGTEAERLQYAVIASTSAVARAFDGPMAGTSLGAVTMTETFGMLSVLVGIMSVQAVVRHTRQEEETGRRELVGSAAVGRYAPLTAALSVAVGANLVLLFAVVGSLVANGLPVVGSVAAAAALAGVGISFAAFAAIAAQVSSTQRGANGIGGAAVGIAFLLRAVGDAAGSVAPSGVEVVSAWPSWASPIGWGQQLRAFHDERWWILGLYALLVAVLVGVAFRLTAARDVGAGLIEVRPGPATAGRRLLSPLGLAWRLQRGVLLAWAVGLTVIGAAFGAIGDEADELLATSDELAAALAALGEAELVDLYFAFFVGILAVVGAGFTVQALLRVRAEEIGGRAEPVLATGVGRTTWLLSHVTLAALGTLAILTMAGLSAGLGYAAATGDTGRIGPLLVAAWVHAPAALALGGFVVAALGIVPRWSAALGWAGLVTSLVMGQLGQLLDLPQAVLNISPFTHPPAVPAEDVAVTPIVLLLLVATALALIGIAAFRRRDIST
jgi:ABC-2 type transport system permease protein